MTHQLTTQNHVSANPLQSSHPSQATVRASISTASETFGKDNSSYRRINFYNPPILHQSATLDNILQMMMLRWKICVAFFAA